jgi:hypothetical protein
VFNENVGQEGVMDWLKESIDSFIIGYNVSLLAYGQSGAGKSYTMGTSGPTEQNDPWQMGILSEISNIDSYRRDSACCKVVVRKIGCGRRREVNSWRSNSFSVRNSSSFAVIDAVGSRPNWR